MGDYRKIDIDLYTYGGKQDIDLWLRRYTRAVDNMLDDAAVAATKTAAYLKYIGTKLGDDFALQIYEASSNQDNWTELRKELVNKLSDPGKAQDFRDKLDYIKWDGEMPLHAYENLILTTTTTLDPDVKSNDNLFARDTYKRFMAGLPPDYQTYVDMGMPMRTHDIAAARQRAEKYQDILKKNMGRSPLASWASPAATQPLASFVPGTSAFAAAAAQPLSGFAAFKENTALQSITDQISLLSLNQKENIETQKETNKNITSLLEHLATSRNSSQDRYRPRYRTPSGERQYYNDNQQQGRYRDNSQQSRGYQNDNRQSRGYQNDNRQSRGYQNDNRQSRGYQNDNRQSRGYQNDDRQQGNRTNYRSPHNSPGRQDNFEQRGSQSQGSRYRYDQSGDRGGSQGRSDRNKERSEVGGQNSDKEQIAPKKLDFQLPADNSAQRESRERRQSSPYPSQNKEDF